METEVIRNGKCYIVKISIMDENSKEIGSSFTANNPDGFCLGMFPTKEEAEIIIKNYSELKIFSDEHKVATRVNYIVHKFKGCYVIEIIELDVNNRPIVSLCKAINSDGSLIGCFSTLEEAQICIQEIIGGAGRGGAGQVGAGQGANSGGVQARTKPPGLDDRPY